MYEDESTGPMVVEDRPRINDVVREGEYRQTKQSVLRDYEINIRFLSVGCIVSVGCRQIPFRNITEAMEEVNKYVQNPTQERERWYKIFNSEE